MFPQGLSHWRGSYHHPRSWPKNGDWFDPDQFWIAVECEFEVTGSTLIGSSVELERNSSSLFRESVTRLPMAPEDRAGALGDLIRYPNLKAECRLARNAVLRGSVRDNSVVWTKEYLGPHVYTWDFGRDLLTEQQEEEPSLVRYAGVWDDDEQTIRGEWTVFGSTPGLRALVVTSGAFWLRNAKSLSRTLPSQINDQGNRRGFAQTSATRGRLSPIETRGTCGISPSPSGEGAGGRGGLSDQTPPSPN